MTVFVPESIKVLGSDAGGASVVLCDMFVDDLDDLPAQDAYAGYKLSMGCTATVINDNSRHRINSAGQWVQIAAGTATYTKAEIDSMIARIDATEAEDRAALVEQVDGGAKNIANFTFGGLIQNENVKPGTIVCTENDGVFDFSGTSDNKNYAAYILKQIKVKAGKYIISGVSGGSNRSYWMRLGSGTTDTFLFNIYDGTREVNFTSDMLLTVQFVIYANQTVSNIIVSPMLCTASDYAISPAFVPYAPTNRQLYELIKQYHP